jgi:hypothetical protein
VAHEYPLVRHFARRAIERLLGHPIAVDLDAPRPTLPPGID